MDAECERVCPRRRPSWGCDGGGGCSLPRGESSKGPPFPGALVGAGGRLVLCGVRSPLASWWSLLRTPACCPGLTKWRPLAGGRRFCSPLPPGCSRGPVLLSSVT